MRYARTRAASLATGAIAAITITTSCTVIGTGTGDDGDDAAGGSEVVLLTHDSFVMSDELIAEFEKESGFELVVRAAGDGGELTNKLVLNQDNPQGDVAFGVDNTFASRAVDEGVFEPYEFDTPVGVDDYDLPGDDEHALTPVDNGNVCVNVDTAYFEAEGLAPPETLADLVDPAYEDLFVTPSASTSSPGMAFLLSTIAEFGDEWPDYWADLMANGAKLTSGWSDAYQVDFTQGGGEGSRPIVLSYDSSPAFTVADGTSTTTALLDTCFQQVEYAGLLAGADNAEGGRELIEFLVSAEVQAALPESMFVFPVADGVALPTEWARFATQPTDPYVVDPDEITANRDEWLREWGDVTTR
ncbi:MAG: thiamine ABC transporter substrate-binding protein [Nocardioides sp.]